MQFWFNRLLGEQMKKKNDLDEQKQQNIYTAVGVYGEKKEVLFASLLPVPRILEKRPISQ